MSNLHSAAKYILAVILLGLATAVSAQDSASGDHVRVRWLAPQSFAAGETETIGFYFEVDPEWHVYWRNAGDSGAAPRFDITTDGAGAGEIQWPFPVRLPIEHLTNLGYKGNVAYLFDVTPAADADGLSLKVNLEWLVCKINCIPGFGTMSLERPVTTAGDWSSGDRALRDRFAQRVPAAGSASPWQAVSLSESGGDKVRLTLEGPDQAPRIFPLDGELLTAQEPALHTDGNRLHYTFERVPGAQRPEAAGFVVSDGERAWQFDGIPFAAAPADTAEGEVVSLWWLLLAAFAGGALLNLMPCVFPVLSIKLFGLINAHTGAAGRLREGLVYSAGVVVTFAALGGLLLALRAGGVAVGWGFQLQSAPVVLALILLFWLMALSFSGVFEFGHRLMNLAGSSRGGSFATGVLAVFVAAPCTGPFMGAALGAAAVLPAASAMTVFVGLGAGLAAPFLLLCASPALLERLPAPGPWMEKFRQLLAFPLYATVIWLLWVLGRLLGDSGWLIGTLLLLAVVFALWLGRNFARAGRVAGYLLAIGALATAFGALRAPETEPQLAQGGWQPYDRAAIEEARANGRAVFIDYTAAWCITCQVNKKLVLDTPATMALFAANGVLLVRADWTSQDPAITRALAELGRNSVPVYAWYPPGAGEPQLLPQILQQHMIAGLFDAEANLQLTEDERP